MELITAEDVKTRMGLPSELLDADESIESAIRASTEYISSILDTPLEYTADRSDTFFVTADQFPAFPGQHNRLRLKQFNVEVGTPVLTMGESLNALTAVNPEYYFVDLVNGLVHIDKEQSKERYVTVVYSAGYQDGDTIPAYLVDAILAYVPGVMNAHQTTNRNDEYKSTIDECRKVAAGILAPHMRGTAFHYRPIF